MTISTLPAATGRALCGIGLRAPHYQDFLRRKPALDFVEVHSENFFGVDAEIGGAPRQLLERVRADYGLSLHGIGLSLGAAEPVQRDHLQQLKWLDQRFAPRWMSDHLAWVGIGGLYANDLLPLPYTEESLAVVRDNVLATQDFLGRRILVENPSSYLSFTHSTIAEWEFLNALASSADCGILLDINNIYVSACNHGFAAADYLSGIPAERVRQVHLAGHTPGEIVIDTHDRPVCDAVWSLYESAIGTLGDVAVMIERDDAIPPLAELLAELDRARAIAATARAELAI